MKTFALAATVFTGLLCTASSADAQFRRSTGYYGGTAYGYPTYVAPTYAVPGYNGVVGVGSYTPLGGTTMVVPSGGVPYGSYAPTYSSGSYYSPTYNSGIYPTTPYYNFNGSYASPYGSSRNRGWRY